MEKCMRNTEPKAVKDREIQKRRKQCKGDDKSEVKIQQQKVIEEPVERGKNKEETQQADREMKKNINGEKKRENRRGEIRRDVL